MNLPSINVTANQKSVILDAFGGEEAFLFWLNSAVNAYVVGVQRQTLSEAKEEEIAIAIEEFSNTLPQPSAPVE